MDYINSNQVWKILCKIDDYRLISSLSTRFKQISMLSNLTQEEKSLYKELWLLCDDWITEEDVKVSAIPFRSI